MTDEPVRILHILTGMGSGGAESFILNMLHYIDTSKVAFDFMLFSRDNFYSEELEHFGCKVYYMPSFIRYPLRSRKKVKEFFNTHNYTIVHRHANALLYMYAIKRAKKMGVSCRIMHSHNDGMIYKWLLPLHFFNKLRIEKLATHYFACSENAGKWMFPCDYAIIDNGIELERYKYDKEAGINVRSELCIPQEAFLLGNIGRLYDQKNQVFAIDVLSDVIKMRPSSYLLIVGEGELGDKLIDRASKLGIRDHVILTGARKDIPAILSAMNVFVFPSLYEGLGIAALEAQANGLQIVCSDGVISRTCCTETSHRISLDKGSEFWAKYILSLNCIRKNNTEQLKKAGFDAKEQSKKLQEFYLNEIFGNNPSI